MKKKFIKYSELIKFVFSILNKVGLDKFSNDCVTKGLCEASLRGVDSHGIRLLNHYVNSAIYGRKNPKPKFKFKKKISCSWNIRRKQCIWSCRRYKSY